MRVLVTGDRHWRDQRRTIEVLDAIHAEKPITLLIEGCAAGADQLAGDHRYPQLSVDDPWGEPGWAWVRHIPPAHYPADWNRYGRAAGPIRNRQMLVEGQPDLVVAFHNSLATSKGTRNMVEQARKAGVPVRLFTSDGEALL